MMTRPLYILLDRGELVCVGDTPGDLLAAINGGLMEGAGNEWQWAGNRTAEARA